jgi:carbonic anhydrase/acetyltransferase-like protein (isoleucine patch superfamily)
MHNNTTAKAEAALAALVGEASDPVPPYAHATPLIDASAFIADNAVVRGDVSIGAETSIWFGCVLRGDVQTIRIGARCNIQDGTIIHASTNGEPTRIGDDVTVGHAAVLHACTLESGAFVGLGALVLDRAIVRSEGMLAAGAVLTSGKVVGAGELWAGNPARLLRELRPEERSAMGVNVLRYVALGKHYRSQDALVSADPFIPKPK